LKNIFVANDILSGHLNMLMLKSTLGVIRNYT